jgi:radical SAM superfamily enzyme YgiQ (UPF0313 family)
MRVLLISANTETINMPVLPLGMACVAKAVEDAGHEVHQTNLMTKSNATHALIRILETFKPEIIGVSVRNIDDQASHAPRFLLDPVKDIVAACRKHSKASIVLGGAGYSIFPRHALEYLGADMGIQGEGERSFPLLLETLNSHGKLSVVPGLFHRELNIQNRQQVMRDIDTFILPGPERQNWVVENAADETIWIPIQTRRGCPLNCSYCSTSTIEGKIIRKRSIDRVMDAMRSYVSAGFDHFFFVDNTFNLPIGYAKHLCEAMLQSGLKIKWRGILYPWQVDEELVALMIKSGCTEISLGFESGSDRILAKMNKRFCVKDVRNVSELLISHDIRCMGFLLFGGPGESRETVLESLEFVDSLHLGVVKVTVGLRIYPHTTLAEYARQTGVIAADDNLLLPRFFIQEGMESWIRDTMGAFIPDRPNWIY